MTTKSYNQKKERELREFVLKPLNRLSARGFKFATLTLQLIEYYDTKDASNQRLPEQAHRLGGRVVSSYYESSEWSARIHKAIQDGDTDMYNPQNGDFSSIAFFRDVIALRNIKGYMYLIRDLHKGRRIAGRLKSRALLVSQYMQENCFNPSLELQALKNAEITKYFMDHTDLDVLEAYQKIAANRSGSLINKTSESHGLPQISSEELGFHSEYELDRYLADCELEAHLAA